MCPNLIKDQFRGIVFFLLQIFNLLLVNFFCRLSFLFATDVFLEKFQKGFLVRLGRPRRLFTRSKVTYLAEAGYLLLVTGY